VNRKGVPKDLAKLKLKPGDIRFRTCDPMTVLGGGHDKHNVNTISTLHDASIQVDPRGKVNRQNAPFGQFLVLLNVCSFCDIFHALLPSCDNRYFLSPTL